MQLDFIEEYIITKAQKDGSFDINKAIQYGDYNFTQLREARRRLDAKGLLRMCTDLSGPDRLTTHGQNWRKEDTSNNNSAQINITNNAPVQFTAGSNSPINNNTESKKSYIPIIAAVITVVGGIIIAIISS